MISLWGLQSCRAINRAGSPDGLRMVLFLLYFKKKLHVKKFLLVILSYPCRINIYVFNSVFQNRIDA